MKSPQIIGMYQNDPDEGSRYSDLQVCQSASGYFIGTLYTNPNHQEFNEPGSRDSGYFPTRVEAEAYLKKVEASPYPEALLRLAP